MNTVPKLTKLRITSACVMAFLLSAVSSRAQFQFKKIAELNTPSPGSAFQFGSFGEVSIDASGVAFWGTGGPHDGIFRYSCGICAPPNVSIACVGEPFLDVTSDQHGNHFTPFNDYSAVDLGIFGESVLYQGAEPISGEPAVYRVRMGTKTLSSVAKWGDTLFGQPGSIMNVFGGIIAVGAPVFIAEWGDDSSYNAGVLSRSPGLAILVDRSTPVPPANTSVFGDHTGNPFSSVAGDDSVIAFQAGFSGAIYSIVGGVVRRVVDFDTLVPDSTETYFLIGRPQVRGGKVFFSGTAPYGRYNGIYRANYDGSGLVTLVDDIDTPVPGAPHRFYGATFWPYDDENGVLIFTASGQGYYEPAAEGVFMAVNGVVTPILTKGMSLGGKTVQTATSFHRGIQCGQVPLKVRFTDDSEAIYLTTVSAGSTANGMFAPGSTSYSPTTGFRSTFLGTPGAAYRVQSATNLVSGGWVTITNFVYSAPAVIIDASVPASPLRFYRAVSP